MFSVSRWLCKLGLSASATPYRRRRVRLEVEALEDRLAPTVAFKPIFGAEKTFYTHGTGFPTTLVAPPVFPIFWGSYWQSPPYAAEPISADLANVVFDAD